MMDLTTEEVLEAVDRLVAGLLERSGVRMPPVDALALAEDHLGLPVQTIDPEVDDRGRMIPHRRRGGNAIILTEDMTEEQRQRTAAQGIAYALLPNLLQKLGISQDQAQRSLLAHLRTLMIPRLLVPTSLLRNELKQLGYDLPRLYQRFHTASCEMIAQRFLDQEDPCVITIADEGVVAFRRANHFAVTRKLMPPEQQCLDRVIKWDRADRVRSDSWTVDGWPIPDRPERRVILRSVPDEF